MPIFKTVELEGVALDYAALWAFNNYAPATLIHEATLRHGFLKTGKFMPSSRWEDGGGIIAHEKITTMRVGEDEKGRPVWAATPLLSNRSKDMYGYKINELNYFGETPLIAAMRCFVATTLGETLELPDEVAQSQPPKKISSPSL